MQTHPLTTGKEDVMGRGRLRFVLIAALGLIVAWAFTAEVLLERRAHHADPPAAEEARDARR